MKVYYNSAGPVCKAGVYNLFARALYNRIRSKHHW